MADGNAGSPEKEVDREQDGEAMVDADEGSGAGYGNNADEPAGDETEPDGADPAG